MNAILQPARTLCCYDFEISTWYRIIFVELIFNINGAFRVIVLFNERKFPSYQPLYWRYVVGAFIAYFSVFFPLKLWFLFSGLAMKNYRRLKMYALINKFVTPLIIPLIIYLRWRQWLQQTDVVDTAVEIGVFVIFITVGAWGIFYAVPRLVQKLDFTSLKRLEKYVALQPIPARQVAEETTPKKLEYERYFRRSGSFSANKNENAMPPESFKTCFISPLHVSIDKDDVVGEGQFGLVYKGSLLQPGGRLLIVAKSAKHDDIHSVVHEVVISVHVGEHPNIVHFLGVTSDSYSGNYFLLSEYCGGGCLLKYLERLKPYKSTQYVNINGIAGVKKIKKLLARFTKEILCGMSYLASKRVVHGDLSARNIVLTDDLKIKICDFGMSTRLYNYQLYSKQMDQEVLPWRWLSIEVLEDLKFSEKSDVYAVGVTVYELYSLGELPYSSLPSWNMDVLIMLRNGDLRLEQPQLANDFVYHVMNLCMQADSTQRPTFAQLEEIFIAQKIT